MTTKPIKDLKKGDFFRLSEAGAVYVRGDYDKSYKKYDCYKFEDVNAFRQFAGAKKVIVDFTF